MRKRKLWLCELLRKWENKQYRVRLVTRNKLELSYENAIECLQQIKDSELWNVNVKSWSLSNNLLTIHIIGR